MDHHEMKQLLPEVFRRTDHPGTPLYAILEIVESMTEPIEHKIKDLPQYFNPYTTPEKFLTFLAGWVDLDRFFIPYYYQSVAKPDYLQMINSAQLRELIVAATHLSKIRGTALGLQSFLEIATGIKGFEIGGENSVKGEPLPFHIKITAPGVAKIYHPLIERIIEQEKPAYVTYTLIYKNQ